MTDKESGIPNNVPEAIDFLERRLSADIVSTEESTPSPDAPVGEQIAHALRAKRLEADTSFLEELKGDFSFARELEE